MPALVRAPIEHVRASSTRRGSDGTIVPRSAPAPRRASWITGWLVGPALLLASACGVILVLRGPDRAFGIALAVLLGISFLWILVSVFWPARADRTCPVCGRPDLKRLDPASAHGVLCDACGHLDPEQSSFLLAEEEGPIEPIVLHDRNSRRASR